MLGKNVTCKITGFTGLVTAECHYLDGGHTAQVTPAGDAEKADWIPVRRLQLVPEAPQQFATASAKKKR